LAGAAITATGRAFALRGVAGFAGLARGAAFADAGLAGLAVAGLRLWVLALGAPRRAAAFGFAALLRAAVFFAGAFSGVVLL